MEFLSTAMEIGMKEWSKQAKKVELVALITIKMGTPTRALS